MNPGYGKKEGETYFTIHLLPEIHTPQAKGLIGQQFFSCIL